MVVDQELPFLLHVVLTLVQEDVVLLSSNRCISSNLILVFKIFLGLYFLLLLWSIVQHLWWALSAELDFQSIIISSTISISHTLGFSGLFAMLCWPSRRKLLPHGCCSSINRRTLINGYRNTYHLNKLLHCLGWMLWLCCFCGGTHQYFGTLPGTHPSLSITWSTRVWTSLLLSLHLYRSTMSALF